MRQRKRSCRMALQARMKQRVRATADITTPYTLIPASDATWIPPTYFRLGARAGKRLYELYHYL